MAAMTMLLVTALLISWCDMTKMLSSDNKTTIVLQEDGSPSQQTEAQNSTSDSVGDSQKLPATQRQVFLPHFHGSRVNFGHQQIQRRKYMNMYRRYYGYYYRRPWWYYRFSWG